GLVANVNRWRKQVKLPDASKEQVEALLRDVTVAGLPGKLVSVDGAEQRIVGAIVPQEQETWFFKLFGPVNVVGQQRSNFDSLLASFFIGKTWFFRMSGPETDVLKHRSHFETLVRSVRLTGKAKPALTWQLPEGWQEEAGDGKFRHATLRTGKGEDALE